MRVLTAAVISADPAFRDAVRESDSVAVTVEIPVAATDVGVEELNELETRHPELIVVQLDDDEPELSLRLVEYLVESARGRPVLVIGPPPSAELLLSAMRAGAAEYLPGPVSPAQLHAAVDRLARRVESDTPVEAERAGRVYTLVGVKGGVGTTMIATNVALELRRRSGEPVILADFCFGLGDAAIHLGLVPRFHVIDLIDNLHRVDPGLLASFVESDRAGLQLLASPGDAHKIDAVEPRQVGEVLRFLRTQYAYTVVDAPDPYSPHARAIFAESDRILLVATPEVPSLRNVERILPLLEPVGSPRSPEVGLVVNRFVPSRSVPVEEIQRMVGVEVLRTVVNDYETVTRSINEGKPLIHNRTPVARDLARLAADLHGPRPAAGPRAGEGARLLRSLTSWARRSGGGEGGA